MDEQPNYSQIVRELVGFGGLDVASLLANAGNEAAQAGIKSKQEGDAKKKSSDEEAAALKRSISADVDWANAEMTLDVAKQSGNSQAISAALQIQQNAEVAASRAGDKLSSDSQDKRHASAQDAATQAAKLSLQDPRNPGKAASMRAWQKVAGAAASSGGGQIVKFTGGGGFLDKIREHPYITAGVTVGVVGTIVLIIRALRKKR